MIVKGWASQPYPDAYGHLIRPYAFKNLTGIPLLWRHREGEPIGTILSLEYRPCGKSIVGGEPIIGLWCECETSGKYARKATHFSLGMTHWVATSYLAFPGQAMEYRVIPEGRLTEISLTNNPGNRYAVITHRLVQELA